MAGGYEHKPDGTEGVGGYLKQLQSQVNSLRGGAGIRSAILRGVQLMFQDENGNTTAIFGRRIGERTASDGSVTTEASNGSSFLDPTTGNTLFTAQKYETTGDSLVQAGTAANLSDLTRFRVFADNAVIKGVTAADLRSDNTLILWSEINDVRISTTTTASAANVYKDPFTSTFYRSTSALKYKTDIADADIEIDEVLALAGRTWVDKVKLERDEPGPIRRNIGFVAEELDDHPSLRQFVVYDEDGEPDAIEYDRLTVALLAVIKDQQKHIEDHEKRITALEGTAPKKGGPSAGKPSA